MAADIDLAILIGVLAAGATLSGGALALRLRSSLGLLSGISSGAIVGIALLDLMPEAFGLAGHAHTTTTVMTAMIVGFGTYLAIDRLLELASPGEPGGRAHLGPASLTVHSFVDGLGIGVAFMVSAVAGIVVAIAVLAHDLLDGANTVALSLGASGSAPIARRWLVADAIAPLAGVLVARKLDIGASSLSLLLSGLAGAFLYIGAVRLLPQSLEKGGGALCMLSPFVGMLFIALVVRMAMA